MTILFSSDCRFISTESANQIIAANDPVALRLVQFFDFDSTLFDIVTAPCLHIIIDLCCGGISVIQNMGILLDNIAVARQLSFDTSTLNNLKNALLDVPNFPTPFSLSPDVSISIINSCSTEKQGGGANDSTGNKEKQYLAFMLALFLMSFVLYRYFKCRGEKCCYTPSLPDKQIGLIIK